MTGLLNRVIAELEKLSDNQQDAIATRLLAELKDEQAWASRFESTTDEPGIGWLNIVRQDI